MRQVLHRRYQGFTLTELAVVMVIIAIMLGGLLIPLSTQRDVQSYKETQAQLAVIREALIGFAITNGRLPRPATSIDNGAENPNDCVNDTQCTGYIPWSTLGVKKTDAWNKMIRYSVSSGYAKNNTTISTTDYATKKVKTRNNNGTISYLIGDDDHACGAAYRCSPAVIFSSGKNNGGTAEDGTQLSDESTTNLDEKANATGTTVFFSRDPSNVPNGGEFDDILIWISPYILFNRMISAGKLP